MKGGGGGGEDAPSLGFPVHLLAPYSREEQWGVHCLGGEGGGWRRGSDFAGCFAARWVSHLAEGSIWRLTAGVTVGARVGWEGMRWGGAVRTVTATKMGVLGATSEGAAPSERAVCVLGGGGGGPLWRWCLVKRT